jgi:hypothetical protein
VVGCATSLPIIGALDALSAVDIQILALDQLIELQRQLSRVGVLVTAEMAAQMVRR